MVKGAGEVGGQPHASPALSKCTDDKIPDVPDVDDHNYLEPQGCLGIL